MKVGIVSPFNPVSVSDYFPNVAVPSINNGATSVDTLVRALLQAGHFLVVFTISDDVGKTEVLVGNNIVVHLIPTRLSPNFMGGKRIYLLDSFYVHKRLANAIKPVIGELDVLHAHWTYDFAESVLPFSGQIPVFITVRDWAPLQFKMQRGSWGKVVWLIKLAKFKKVMGREDVCYIANSEYTMRLILSVYPNSRAVVIHNPIKKELVVLGRRCPAFDQRFVSISVDLDEPRKNISTLIDAFNIYKSHHPEASLHLVGTINKEGSNYKNWQGSNRLDGVFFHGSLNHRDLIHLMDEMSCLVHPSLEETFGNVLVEAMARGVVCIGGEDSGAVPYVLNGGEAGLLCDVKDPQCLFESMNKLNEPNTYLALVNKANEWLRNNYMSDTIADEHIALYRKCAGI